MYGNYYYPYKLNYISSIETGEIFHSGSEFYIINYGLLGENSYIYRTNNFLPVNGITLPNTSVLFAKSFSDKIILLTFVNDSLILVLYSNGTISNKIYISNTFENYYKFVDIHFQKDYILLHLDKNLYLFNIQNNFPKSIQ